MATPVVARRAFGAELALALLAAGVITCGGDNITRPEDTAAAIAEVGGDGQTGTAGATLPESLVVRVTDGRGNPVGGIEVTWAAQDGGQVSATMVATGSDGRASVQQVLGPSAGSQTATANASGLQGSPVTFAETAVEAGIPAELTISNPTSTTVVEPGEGLDPASQPVVVVSDSQGRLIPDVDVSASVGTGNGTLQGTTTATTDSRGDAAFGDLGITGVGVQITGFSAGAAGVTSSPVTVTALPPEAATGKWEPPVELADRPPPHASATDGKNSRMGQVRGGRFHGAAALEEPAAGPPASARTIPADTMLFCAGHTFMADGRLMVSGGHKADDEGLDVTNIFDPVSESWVPGLPKMAKGRWYPTVTTLPDGRLVTDHGGTPQNPW